MSNALRIAHRELGAYFASPLAYIIGAGFLLISGLYFYLNLSYTQSADLRPVFSTIYTILLLLAPALSMRLLAEEMRTGTIELLMTSPIRDFEIVLGKFLGAVGLLAVLLALTLAYPLMVMLWGSPDRGVLIGGYLGGLLFGSAALSIGLFASSMTQNQVVAAVLAFAGLLGLWVADGLAMVLGGGQIAQVLSYASIYTHFNDISKGVIDTKDIVYFLSVIAIALFLSARSLEARRWKA